MGFCADEIIGTKAADYLDPADVLPYLIALEETIEKGRSYCGYRIGGVRFFGLMERTRQRDLVRVKEFRIERIEDLAVVIDAWTE